MKEEDIRLDQTKKVFKVLADLIQNKETCSYRYLIYDILGFDGHYSTLIDGLTITNYLVECEDLQQRIDKAIEYIKSNEWATDYKLSSCRTHLLDILGDEIDGTMEKN